LGNYRYKAAVCGGPGVHEVLAQEVKMARLSRRKPFLLTAEHLSNMGACLDELEAFDAAYPDGVQVTRANVEQAYRYGLSVRWLYANMLSDEVWLHGARVEYTAVAVCDPPPAFTWPALARLFMKYWRRRSKCRQR
jgi:hypothetical protein